MFQQDFLLNEVRKFAEMLAKLMGLKAEGSAVEFNQQAEKMLQQEYDTSLKQLLILSVEDFRNHIENANYSAEKLNALSQLLYVFAEPFGDDDETASLLKKVLIIFDALEQRYHFQSFGNIEKQKHIHQYFITLND